MPKHGNSEVFLQKVQDIKKVYHDLIGRTSYIVCSELLKEIAESPAPRLYVSVDTAKTVISLLDKGKNVSDYKRISIREMYRELYRRYCSLKEAYPNWNREELVWRAVYSPAPSFFITPGGVHKILTCIRKYNGKRIYKK